MGPSPIDDPESSPGRRRPADVPVPRVRRIPERIRPPLILPGDPTFSPSANGRNGWKYEQLYDIKEQVRFLGQLLIYPNSEHEQWDNEMPRMNLTSLCGLSAPLSKAR
jgi:hypothetical protein